MQTTKADLARSYPLRADFLQDMAFPQTSDELKAFGYTFEGHGRCSACGCEIEWYLTPRSKKLPVLRMHKGSDPVTPHWSAGCTQSSLFQ